MADLLDGLAADTDTADRVALLFEDDRWTWAELHAEAVRRAAALTALRGRHEGRECRRRLPPRATREEVRERHRSHRREELLSGRR